MNYSHDLYLIMPVIVLSIGAVLNLLLSSASTKFQNYFTVLVVLSALIAHVLVLPSYAQNETIFNGSLCVDRLTAYLGLLGIVATALVLILSTDSLKHEGIVARCEYQSLMLMSLAGAWVLIAAGEMITLFIALETMSIALYALCGSAVLNPKSSESALKYFVMGSAASALLLFGIVLLYGLTGTTVISEILPKLSVASESGPIFLIALSLIMLGLIFKLALVPLHWWSPDVYQGAPSSVTGFMASVVKLAAFGVTLRLFFTVFADYTVVFQSLIWLVALLSMVGGNLMALRQRSVKRLLAYSSIAHAGYLFMALLAGKGSLFGFDGGAIAPILYYLTVYSVMTIGSFAIVSLVSGSGSDDLTAFNGLSKRAPFLAILFTIFLLGFAGIPPVLGGLLGKVYLFSAAIKSGYIGLSIMGMLSAAVGVYYYLRVIVAMYFIGGESEEKLELPGSGVYVPLSFCALAAILLGVFPGWLYSAVLSVVGGF